MAGLRPDPGIAPGADHGRAPAAQPVGSRRIPVRTRVAPAEYLTLIAAFLSGRLAAREFACAVEDLWVGAEAGAAPWMDADEGLEQALWELCSAAALEFELDLVGDAERVRVADEFERKLRPLAAAAREGLLAHADEGS